MPHRPASPTTRARAFALVVAFVAATLGSVAPATASAASDVEARFLQLADTARSDAGLEPLEVADDLVAGSRTHAVRMADVDDLHHDPDLGAAVTGWDRVGENVGRGPEVGRIHQAFLESPTHRDNLLDPRWTEIGIGAEVRDGTVWVTVRFRLPTPTAEAPAEAPTDPPAEAPGDPLDEPSDAPSVEPSDEATADLPDEAPVPDHDPDASEPGSAPASRAPREVVRVPATQDRVSVVLARLAADDELPVATRTLDTGEDRLVPAAGGGRR